MIYEKLKRESLPFERESYEKVVYVCGGEKKIIYLMLNDL